MKRLFDIFFSFFGLIFLSWLILIMWVSASLNTGCNGFFVQRRIGRYGKPFKIIKIRTMRPSNVYRTSITTAIDPRITRFGALLRSYKLDELPQLFNILIGEMSFVGPRPDVPGYTDCLKGRERDLLLSVRPGITGPATLAYRNEEKLLAQQADPQKYNDEVIFPEKVRINLEYIQNWRFSDDIRYIWKTIFG
jgi:lipopolysaccharide/colanic/teichoic acid biosynthesis glycosyltransferase